MSAGAERATGRRSGELRPGMRVGSFELLGELGRGGMGVVLRARDVASGREVAVKTLLAAPGPHQLERFQREGQILAGLDHGGIVRVHGSGEVQGRPYLVFELVEQARPIDEAARTLPLEERARLVRDAARALGHAHARGVVHRDVKPSNLLVDARGVVRVADFGLAVAADLERLTATGALVGTPETMAPEQCDGRRGAVGPATDVWGLGVVLYQLLTQVMPFSGDSLITIMARVCEARPARPRTIDPAIPRALEAVALAALTADPDRRPADGDALADLIDEALAGRMPGAVDGASRLLGALAALAVAALGVAVGAVVVARGRATHSAPVALAAPAPPSSESPATAPVQPVPEAAAPVASPTTTVVTGPAAALVAPLPQREKAEDILMYGARHLAMQGLPGGMTEYARHLRRAERHAEALVWFRKAAFAGDPAAMEEAGTMISEGRGTPADPVAAALWFELAAGRGEHDAARRLAFSHRLGGTGATDIDAAIDMHRRAVHLRKRESERFELLTALVERGRPEDIQEARAILDAPPSIGRRRWTEELIERRTPDTTASDAEFEVGVRSLEISVQHMDALRRWRRRIAGKPLPPLTPPPPGHKRVRTLVDAMRQAIAAGPPERAFDPIRAAAHAGSAEGMRALAEAYAEGDGTVADAVAAVAWLERAVRAGDASAALRGQELLAPEAEPFGRQSDRVLALLDQAEALPAGKTPPYRTARAEALLARRLRGDADAAAALLREVAAHDRRAALVLGEALAAKRFAPAEPGEAHRALDAVLADAEASALHDRARTALAKLP